MVVNAEQQKEVLNQSGLEMLNLCRSQITKAKEAFINLDCDLAEEVIHTENRVNALDLKIEKECERFLALYNPVATDLRFIMAILKINFDLERIADHAEGISHYVVEEDKKMAPHLLEAVQFEYMFETVNAMFDDITTAYEENDVKSARKVFKKDKVLDKINLKSFSIIAAEIKKDSGLIKQSLVLFSVIKKMERVGDLLKNIGEEIIFYREAQIVKHKKKK
jgi:phosphate transport system protein